ncbi:hypothetical protein HD806DRAFT_542230, partial [Xylariaceae sp. AK1471]
HKGRWIIAGDWLADAFSDAVMEVSASTGDRALHELIALAAAEHIEELVEVEGFNKLEVMSDFAIQVLRSFAKRIRAVQSRL